uniref:Venom hexamerin-like protein 1 n=1 Tax=Pristhesancus plagipennis TaxID=1955184 RepID=A0A2K8JNX3_PRIPG|nr:venom hexamerin-like protein 1 [Pristhesancus plagipennis]
MMKLSLIVFGLVLATAYSTIISTKPERKLADADFLKRQIQVLDLYAGLGHTENFHNEFSDFNLQANEASFVKPEVVKDFLHAYHHGFLPVDGVFTLFCHHTRKDTIRLFDLFYYAKDFDTFYKAASWARKHLNPMQFAYAYTLALLHREDCQHYQLPPLYEVFPNYFVPVETMHHVYDAKMSGVKERRFVFNNTGYEYNYHYYMYGGPLNSYASSHHLDYKVSYFREDVGGNSWYSLSNARFPSWMEPQKYRGSHWYKRGESLYYRHQQLLARYLLERIANGLPYVDRLYWEEPIKTGYNPRVSYVNGEPLYIRPDNVIPKQLNRVSVLRAQVLEKRLLDAIDAGALWEVSNSTLISLKSDEGFDLLGRIIFGVYDRPNKKYFGNYFWTALEALGFVAHTSNDHEYVGGATSNPVTALRDPAFYQFLNRLIGFFQYHKRYLPRYTLEQLNFDGVKVKNFEVDKFVTYFDNYEFEVTNGVPVEKPEDYVEYKYFTRQYRLNHKPYNFKITINSEAAKEGFVRVYIGPKFDAEEHELQLEQKRLAFVEIDRFPVKLAAGENVLERNSKESSIFTSDPEGFRSLYSRAKNALKNTEQYYYSQRYSCGLPNRYQLPRGWKNGQQFTIAVVVTPLQQVHQGDEKTFYSPCGSSKLYDGKPFGFPFDRPLDDSHIYEAHNIYFQDVVVYHKDESDVNRSQQQ